MNIMENKSVWEEERLPEFGELKGSVKTDVLIIGGGIAGLLTAFELQNSGVSCAIAERGRLCRGVTGKTTAKITFQHGLIYGKIAQSRGFERAKMYFEANRNALLRYAELCRDIDCDFQKVDSYIYSKDDRRVLENEIEALSRIGFSAKLCEELDLPLKTAGAVRFSNQAQFAPLKFLSGIVRALSEKTQIFENTHIIELNGKTALSTCGRITADKIVIASHFPFINRHGSYFLKLYQSRSNVVALENAPNLNGIYMDEDKNGLSFRNYKSFLLIGGGAHKTGERCRKRELVEFAQNAYPDAVPRYLWGAQDCVSLDEVPYIGNYSALTPDMYVAAGFNKWGMTNSMAAAEILRDMILGRKNEFAEVFDPSRSILKKQLLINGFNAVKNLLAPRLPRCPHMGCALKWNSAENSWDCPCHGSRFSDDGALLDNPANCDLELK